MPDVNALGSLIQEYVRFKMLAPDKRGSVPALLQTIDAGLRLRVDILGFDSERLLEVPPHQVLTCLEELEHAAHLEDAGWESTAISGRAKEEKQFRGAVSRPRSNHRVRSKR